MNAPFVDFKIKKSEIEKNEKIFEFENPKNEIPIPIECEGNCAAVNCPFKYHYKDKQCLFVHQSHLYPASSYSDVPEEEKQKSGRKLIEYDAEMFEQAPDKIINATFNFARNSGINNIKFVYPTSPMVNPRDEWGWITCPEVIPDEGATCTHVVNVDLGEVVEIRIVNTNNMNDPHRTYHTVHLHGYEFYVTHVGFPVLENGQINVGTENVAKGIRCVDEKCVSHDWNETELESSRVKSPFIRRNTILMASQGFTIIRFRADNPGVWPFHCHLAIHNVDGMAMLINVVDRKHNRYDSCRNYHSYYDY